LGVRFSKLGSLKANSSPLYPDPLTAMIKVALERNSERTAEEESVPSAHRRVFLDDVATEAAVRAQLDEAVAHARNEGGCIAIGHPYPATLAVLERELPRMAGDGVKLVKVGELVR